MTAGESMALAAGPGVAGAEAREQHAPLSRRRACLAAVGAAILVAAAAAAAGPVVGPWVVAAAGVSAALATVAVMPVRGRSRPGWQLMGLGLVVHAGGALASAGTGGDAAALPHPADVSAAVGLSLVGVGLATVARARSRRPDPVARLDSAIVAIGTGTAAVVVLVPRVDQEVTGSVERLAAVVVLGLLVAMSAAAGRFVAARPADTTSGCCLLIGSAILPVGLALGWAARFGLGGAPLAAAGRGAVVLGVGLVVAAALDPAAHRLAEVRPQPPHGLTRPRLALLAVAALAAPVGAVAAWLADLQVGVVPVGVGAAAVVVLILVRLELVVAAARVTAEREVVLRQAAGRISAATDATEVRSVVLDAAADLVGTRLRVALVATVNDRDVPVPEAARDREGLVDPMRTDALDVLARITVSIRQPHRSVVGGCEVVTTGLPTRSAAPSLLVAVGDPTVPEELDEVLAILCTQAGTAIDSIAHAAAMQAERTEARFRELVRHSSDAILIVGPDRRIRYQTPSVVRVLGYLTVDLDGAPVDRFVHPDQASLMDRFLANLLATPHESVRSLELSLLRADDSVMTAEVIGANLLALPEVDGLVLTIRDVTGRRTLEDQLRHQAFHDALTGLANRALFVDRVDHALDRSRRDDGVSPAVAYVDLDDFKTVNDSLGHGAGDELLKVMADRVRSCLRAGDTAARLGGDEFAILLEDATDLSDVLEVADRVLHAVHEAVSIDATMVYVRASIGVAVRKSPSVTTAELLRNADLAMYAAKAKGKGRVEVFEPDMHRRAVDRLSVVSELERSIADGDIGLAYQPIVALRTREVVAFEALARWTHPERGPVPPSEFVPIAEETGLILPLGRMVLERACHQLARWRSTAAGRSWRVSVNLSARQLLAPDLVQVVREATGQAGLAPAALTLELTESVLVSDSERVLARLHTLKELGVQIALDDFGTGYSSLSYLQRVPFDVIKVDRAFVQSLQTDEPESTLANTIVDLARTLGRSTVAEGIEHEVEVAGLLALGCELGQGHLFGPASDASSLARDLGLAVDHDGGGDSGGSCTPTAPGARSGSGAA